MNHQLELLPRARVAVAPGAVHVPGWLGLDRQRDLLAQFRCWATPPAGLRRPHMPDGTPMRIEAVCLGWHWYPHRYSRTCDDTDGALVKGFPDSLKRLAIDAVEQTLGGSSSYEPDSAIVNRYGETSRLGLHQDRDESADARRRGSPVVTVSLGDACVFRFGNPQQRSSPYRDIVLQSGDLFVFGGPSRRAYHGVLKILPATSPRELEWEPSRISITVRESGMTDRQR